MGREWYKVRIRLPDGGRTNRYYRATSPRDAASKYRGKGHIISSKKCSGEYLAGVGEFLRLGDSLLQELRLGRSKKRRLQWKKE